MDNPFNRLTPPSGNPAALDDLSVSRACMARLVDSNVLGVLVTENGTITEANDAFLRMVGYSRDDVADGRLRWTDLTTPEHAEADARVLDDLVRLGGCPPMDKELVRKDGGRCAVLVGGAVISRSPLQTVWFVLDLTERRLFEERLRRAQRMESIVHLAGGIAHDFNDLLTAILGSTELLLENEGLGSEVRADVEEIRKAAKRAAQLTHQLLAFSRRQAPQPRVLDLNAILHDLRIILRHLLGDHLEIATDFDPDVPPVLADLAQLEQIVVDVALEARDRMPAGGRLTLATKSVRVDPAFAEAHPGLRPGRYAMLVMRNAELALEGATLDSVYGVVRQSGGYFAVQEEPGMEAGFTLYLAAVDQAPREGPSPAAPELPGGETILLVDDEEQVRALGRRVLERVGYTVVTAADTQEAIQIANRHAGTIHLLLVDMVLPYSSGRELAAQLAIHRPAIKVLYISGTIDETIGRHQVLAPGTAFLQKPFSLDHLVRKVRQVLDTPTVRG
jgi:two-component system, cell cycle sensor histidine kinase and response regulator CckA